MLKHFSEVLSSCAHTLSHSHLGSSEVNNVEGPGTRCRACKGGSGASEAALPKPGGSARWEAGFTADEQASEWPFGLCGIRNLTKNCSEIVLGKQPAHMQGQTKPAKTQLVQMPRAGREGAPSVPWEARNHQCRGMVESCQALSLAQGYPPRGWGDQRGHWEA